MLRNLPENVTKPCYETPKLPTLSQKVLRNPVLRNSFVTSEAIGQGSAEKPT